MRMLFCCFLLSISLATNVVADDLRDRDLTKEELCCGFSWSDSIGTVLSNLKRKPKIETIDGEIKISCNKDCIEFMGDPMSATFFFDQDSQKMTGFWVGPNTWHGYLLSVNDETVSEANKIVDKWVNGLKQQYGEFEFSRAGPGYAKSGGKK